MKDELTGTAEMKNRKQEQTKLVENLLKVDIKEVYNEKPLLMESKGTKK